MAVTVENVNASLALLGDSETVVIKELKKRGIKGTPNDAKNCILANYLKLQFPKEKKVHVGSYIIVNGAKVPASSVLDTVITNFDLAGEIVVRGNSSRKSKYEKNCIRKYKTLLAPLATKP